MRNYTVIRFVVAEMLISIGSFFLLEGFTATGMLVCSATLLFTPRSELTQPLPSREMWQMFGVVGVIFGGVLALEHFVSPSIGHSVQVVIRHPAFVASFWLVMLWGLYSSWQRQRAVEKSITPREPTV